MIFFPLLLSLQGGCAATHWTASVELLVSYPFPLGVFRELRRFSRGTRCHRGRGQLLHTQLSKADGRVIDKVVALRPLPGFLASFLILFVSSGSLGADLEKLRHRLGQLLDYIGARGTSLVEQLDNAPESHPGYHRLWCSPESRGDVVDGRDLIRPSSFIYHQPSLVRFG